MSRETLQTRYGLKEIAPRLVVGAIAANASLSLTGLAITFANALSRAVMGSGVSPTDVSASIGNMITNAMTGNVFLGLVALVFAVMVALVVITYLIRISITLVLIVASPLMLVTHCLPQTDGLARLWWRAIVGCLGTQIAQSLVLLTAIRVLLNGQSNVDILNPLRGGGALIYLLLGCCLMLLLIRIPVWITHSVLGGGHRSRAAGMLKNIALYKGFQMLGVTRGFRGGGQRGGSSKGGASVAGGVRRRATGPQYARSNTGRRRGQLALFDTGKAKAGFYSFDNFKLTKALRDREAAPETSPGNAPTGDDRQPARGQLPLFWATPYRVVKPPYPPIEPVGGGEQLELPLDVPPGKRSRPAKTPRPVDVTKQPPMPKERRKPAGVQIPLAISKKEYRVPPASPSASAPSPAGRQDRKPAAQTPPPTAKDRQPPREPRPKPPPRRRQPPPQKPPRGKGGGSA
jgi:hypothetical protein